MSSKEPASTSPYHAGERAIHERLGIVEQQESVGQRAIRDHMPDQHREFFAQLPYFVVGSVDKDGWPWASILFGEPGFVSTPDNKHIRVDSYFDPMDPLAGNLREDAPLSFLGIEMHTRRRNRANVTIESVDEDGFLTKIDQSFGNCPKYINHRAPGLTKSPTAAPATIRKFSNIDMAIKQTIEEADFFFVASHIRTETDRKTEGVDVNHRGGKPGFVQIEGNTLTIPDYFGNSIFNTLGNFMLNPRAGLIFHNPANASLIQMVGTTEIIWDGDPILAHFEGAHRAWRFSLDHGIERMQSVPMRWKLEALSPSFMKNRNTASLVQNFTKF
ncbi:MAG: pyridoxamine 5'-phosphate oxidase family protein [Rhizobiaceae bacterium]|nr:pyridoxamine 5'-phosphate oxidase family protein [Rhizobiaceae bacterium]